MSRTLALSVIAIALAPLCAMAQSSTDSVTPPPPMPEVVEELPLDRGSDAKQTDDSLERIERRLEQIEKRLERSESRPVVVEQEPSTPPETTIAGENWRYRNYNGVWWYWLPSNRWVYWSNGEWVDFVTTTQPPPPVYQSYEPAYSYVPSDIGYSYVPSYGGYYGYSGYPRYYSSYSYYPRYGGYYGNGYYGNGDYGGGWVSLGLSIADALGDNRRYGRYYGRDRSHYYRFGGDDDDDDDDDDYGNSPGPGTGSLGSIFGLPVPLAPLSPTLAPF